MKEICNELFLAVEKDNLNEIMNFRENALRNQYDEQSWISQNPVRCSPEQQFRRANIFYDSPDGLGLFRLPFGRPGPRF